MAWVLGYPVETALAPVVMALCEPREALKGELPADGDVIFQRHVLCAVLSDPTASLVELSAEGLTTAGLPGALFSLVQAHGMVS